MRNSFLREPIRQLLETIVDNRGMTVPAADDGIPLIATNCIKETSLYPTFENIRYVSEETHRTWFRAHLQPEDILFVNKGTPGRVCMVPDPVSFCAAQDMIGLRADRSKVYPRYLFAFLRSDWVKEKIRNYHVGLAIPHFKKQDLDAITVPKRSDYEQKAIGDLYFLLSEKIELNNRINAELEGMAKLLYDYWFVQFDFPMTAAQAAALGKPHLTGHPYRASGGKMVWSQELKREVPEDWRVGNLGELCDIFDGPHATPTKTESGPYYLSISSLENGRLDLAKSARISEAEFVKWTRRVTPTAGDVLFSYETRLGEAALMPAEIRACLGRRMGLLRPKRDQVSPAFLLQSYLSQAFQGVIRANVIQGATVERILLNDLPSFPMLIPALEQRDAASKILTPLHGKIAQNQRQTQELTALRDWLLPMLMNGQVTVG